MAAQPRPLDEGTGDAQRALRAATLPTTDRSATLRHGPVEAAHGRAGASLTLAATRMRWLVRRLRRMYAREVPYRAGSLVRALAQRAGFFSASHVPAEAADATWGPAWCSAPQGGCGAALRQAANDVMAGKLQVFGQSIDLHDGVPDWNTDPMTGTRIATSFGLFIDFRHIGSGVDIKFLWEINRHAWWLPLAQCYAQTRERAYLQRLEILLSSWLEACPYPLGANWSSPVESGIRLINWSLVWHLIGGAASPMFESVTGQSLLTRWLSSIYQHIVFASDNYSKYSSADNHLIGEAAGVFVASHTWDRWLQVRRLRQEAKLILEREASVQFSSDGVCLEQAFCYQKFSLQFLLASGICARASSDAFPAAYWSRIEAALTFVASVMDCAGKVPPIGDSDDGDVWRLGHESDFNGHASLLALGGVLFGRVDLQTKAQAVMATADSQLPWLTRVLQQRSAVSTSQVLPTRFVQGGYVVLGRDLHTSREFRVTFDCGPLGSNRVAGHGHADALSVLVSWAGESLLVDSGTFCYNAAPEYRHFFRGTHAHNTLVIDGQDQSEYGASFLWLRDINCTVWEESDGPVASIHASHDGYARFADPVIHHRRVTLDALDCSLIVEDWLDCARSHEIELLWHVAPGARLQAAGDDSTWRLRGARHSLLLSIEGRGLQTSVIEGRESPPQGWVSSKFYERVSAPVLSVRGCLAPGQVLRTLIQCSTSCGPPSEELA